jgi:hypothetical protein
VRSVVSTGNALALKARRKVRTSPINCMFDVCEVVCIGMK